MPNGRRGYVNSINLLYIIMEPKLIEPKKGNCIRCKKPDRMLFEAGICIFCKNEVENKEVAGTVVKTFIQERYEGMEIKSPDGDVKRNLWMR